MTEWGVYLVVASLIATAILIGKPLVNLTKINTKLECAVEKLTEAMKNFEIRMKEFEEDNKKSHKRLWEHNEKQDKIISDHEAAIQRINDQQNQNKGS